MLRNKLSTNPGQKSSSRRSFSDFPEALDKSEGVVKA
jgi:hypothetical protein